MVSETPPAAGVPTILADIPERSLAIVLRAVVEANEDSAGRTSKARIAQALAILLGRHPRRGSAGVDRDELLEHLAFDYSVATRHEGRDVSVTEIAKRLVDFHPLTAGRQGNDSIVRDLVRKFETHRDALLAAHSFDGSENFEAFYAPIVAALDGLSTAGVAVDWTTLPPGARQGR